jgi:hypothetical protein
MKSNVDNRKLLILQRHGLFPSQRAADAGDQCYKFEIYLPKYIQNCYNMYPKKFQLQGFTKCTKIAVSGMQINHPAKL